MYIYMYMCIYTCTYMYACHVFHPSFSDIRGTKNAHFTCLRMYSIVCHLSFPAVFILLSHIFHPTFPYTHGTRSTANIMCLMCTRQYILTYTHIYICV